MDNKAKQSQIFPLFWCKNNYISMPFKKKKLKFYSGTFDFTVKFIILRSRKI